MKLRRRKSSKSVKSMHSADEVEKAAMEQRLRAANFSQDAVVIRNAVHASQDIGYYGNESPEYKRALKLLRVIALESDVDSGVGPDGGPVDVGLCPSPGPVMEVLLALALSLPLSLARARRARSISRSISRALTHARAHTVFWPALIMFRTAAMVLTPHIDVKL